MKDSRLHEFEFQTGYCLSYYWHAMVLFFFARARREAQLFSVQLLWIQAAADIKGLDAQPKEEQEQVLKALLRTWNVHDTAHLHTLWPAYPGERVRLLETYHQTIAWCRSPKVPSLSSCLIPPRSRTSQQAKWRFSIVLRASGYVSTIAKSRLLQANSRAKSIPQLVKRCGG